MTIDGLLDRTTKNENNYKVLKIAINTSYNTSKHLIIKLY